MPDRNEWDNQAKSYERTQLRSDSLDSLIEYPAQLSAIGNVKGRTILDIGCGSGRKAYDWIKAGAQEVYAFDITTEYERPWGDDIDKPLNLHVFQCDLQDFHKHQLLLGKKFDIVTSLQTSGYGAHPTKIFERILNCLKPDGLFVYTTAHPMRYAVERCEAGTVSLAEAYHDKTPYTYPGTWNKNVTSAAYPMTISERVNALLDAGFIIERIDEPFMNRDLALEYPHKYDWMKKYFRMILFKARASNKRLQRDAATPHT